MALSRKVSLASINATVVVTGPGRLCQVIVGNANAAVRYLKFYDKASSPTLASDTPFLVIPIPPANAAPPINCDIPFVQGLGFVMTTGGADTNTGAVAADEIFLTLTYL